ncbi:iron ABC transporter permease [Sphingomonas koreensis]|jgi:iron complex transport system permease protein|uniref:ABC transporter permease n=1 Tax=Sphingomonas koreensis TaxID=93064 RepID=A0A1L6JAP5_9SPHN|nr:iron ABC transporter permease [Sphingomonas koreensis]APR53005.1 ABC transporter permease [Sphingomonas koreensis]MDC7811367.1 iron ABC transporter permease [Sphingomonas koreensis]RSU18198.1 iron ABC transporter permease [Sphingomonas koreensis]RSU23508.1 iron ABC transporter permease [Sphingomonas koreensis]RSU25264.1 iron ABC transporter permease [Sphingomonas koreensis]
MTRGASFRLNGLLLVLTALAALASLGFGTVSLAPDRVIAALLGKGDMIASTIVLELRMPRMLLGLLVGAMLGLAGAALQGFLRNPLAEPSVLGASNAAAFGAVIALYFGIAELHPALLPLLAIASAMVALVLLFGLSGQSESALTLILAGIAIATLAGAGISLALNLSPNPFAAMEIMNWLLGSLENRSSQHVWIALPCIVVGAALLLWDARALDALTLGEDGARALGINLRAVRWRLLVGVAIGVGGAVAVSGSIGFIGLIVPHIIRPFTDRSPSAILWPSAIGGALLLTLSDLGVRMIPATNELKLGVVTAFLGIPVFLVHLLRERRLW